MIAKISTGRSIQGMLNYNEQKVKKGAASLILANGYADEAGALSFYDKLGGFSELTHKNQRTKTNAVHISLSFSANDKVDTPTMQAIADSYMEQIGFGDQPYLVYRHFDTSHPHIHLVTTNIRADGSRINMHNLGKTKSEAARKWIEEEFRLVKAEEQKPKTLKPLHIEKAQYGKGETKTTIGDIVEQVVKNYKYASLPELNAILSQFNINASRGEPGTRQYENGGLVYSITDDKGHKLGVPIKASALQAKPTLKNLQKRFARNRELRKRDIPRLRGAIDQVLSSDQLHTKESLQQALKKKGIVAIFRTNAEGRNYGITFVDNVNRVAFKGSDLGKEYGVNAMINRMEGKPAAEKEALSIKQSDKAFSMEPNKYETPDLSGLRNLLEALTSGYAEEEVAYGFRKKKKRRSKNL
ncbi:relaxase/mobilization nuclease domain-containing protein [Roseivirga sp. BDSF3-8]|uniref:relaxase/mobilization nuclease domain-containing protein n=1 Tax=Roseivirga sp. BDSF3-8 TaxID=3241598 RepID=UPI003531B37A